MEYVTNLTAVLSDRYGADHTKVNMNLFKELSEYAFNKGNDPISLIGILNYHVAKAEGKSEFHVHNVKSLLGSDYAQQVENTKAYLDSKGIKYTTEKVIETQTVRGRYNGQDHTISAEYATTFKII